MLYDFGNLCAFIFRNRFENKNHKTIPIISSSNSMFPKLTEIK